MAKQIKLVKSLIGRKSDQIATAHYQAELQPDRFSWS